MTTRRQLPPGPPRASGFGEELLRLRDLQADVFGVIGRRFAVYGDFFHTPGRVPSYATCDPDLMHEVLVAQARSFTKRTTSLEILGKGLLTADGEFWRRQRRLIQPGFQRESIQRYGSIITEEVETLLARWAERREVELRREMHELTLRVVCRALFGQHFKGNAERLGRAVSTLQEGVLKGILLPRWVPTPFNVTRPFMERVVDREVFSILDAGDGGAGSLLAELRAATDEHGKMSREQLRDEVVTLFLAGHETTALLLTWCLYLIALHPDVEAAVAGEAQAVAGTGPVGTEHRDRLEYTERALEETLRLYPSVYVIPRVVAEPVSLGGYRLEPASEVWLWPYFSQRDARYFARPERFVPDRFLPGGEHEKSPRAYLPFGAGSRACVGRHFAMLEAVLALSAIVRHFRLTLTDHRTLKPHPRITLAPARAIRVRLRTR